MSGIVRVNIEITTIDENDAQELRRAWKVVLEALRTSKATITVGAQV